MDEVRQVPGLSVLRPLYVKQYADDTTSPTMVGLQPETGRVHKRQCLIEGQACQV